ncbi:MAG: lysophospholipase [Anaerolineaceae bacterium]
MDIKESTIQTSDGLRLYTRAWSSAQPARAVAVLLHGVGEHCQRYDPVAERFCERGFSMLGYDRRGHGRSEGRQGVIGSVDQLVTDFTQVIALAKTENPGLPVFLYGHSLGALDVLFYALLTKPDVKGIIATSPPLDSSTIPEKQKKLIRTLEPLLPHLTIASKLDQSALSRDQAVIEAYRADPLVHDKVSVRLGAHFVNAPEYIFEHIDEWHLPLYLAHGTEDRICPIKGSDRFALNVPVPITYQRWDGLYHETHNEPEKEQVISAMLAWMDAQLN